MSELLHRGKLFSRDIQRLKNGYLEVGGEREPAGQDTCASPGNQVVVWKGGGHWPSPLPLLGQTAGEFLETLDPASTPECLLPSGYTHLSSTLVTTDLFHVYLSQLKKKDGK